MKRGIGIKSINRHCKCQSIIPRKGRSNQVEGHWAVAAQRIFGALKLQLQLLQPLPSQPKRGPKAHRSTGSPAPCSLSPLVTVPWPWCMQQTGHYEYLDLTLQGPTIFIFLIHVNIFPLLLPLIQRNSRFSLFDTSPSFPPLQLDPTGPLFPPHPPLLTLNAQRNSSTFPEALELDCPRLFVPVRRAV